MPRHAMPSLAAKKITSNPKLLIFRILLEKFQYQWQRHRFQTTFSEGSRLNPAFLKALNQKQAPMAFQALVFLLDSEWQAFLSSSAQRHNEFLNQRFLR